MTRIQRFTSCLAIAIVLASCSTRNSDLHPVNLKCEYRIEPTIDKDDPRFEWRFETSSQQRNRSQTAYRILVASDLQMLNSDQADLWDTGKRNSDHSLQIEYAGKPFQSGQTIYWKVKIWDEDSLESAWSEPAKFHVGLLADSDWRASWIGFDEAWSDTTIKSKPWANRMKQKTDYRPLPAPYLRKDFELTGNVKNAKVYITALGIYELYINGNRVGDDYFNPGWTDYNTRIYYNTYEVGQLLKPGKNTIAAVLGDGWYVGNVANRGQYRYGKKLRLKAQLVVEHESSCDTIVTDGSWKASYGPIREGDMQGGETYDARLEMPDWNTSEFNDSNWKSVTVIDTITAQLQLYPGEPIRKIEEIKPVSVFKLGQDTFIVDMGQNFAGWARLKVSGTRGDSVVMRFAEKLNADSSLHTRNLRTARCTDTYVLKGEGEEIWEPRFTYHGYQFIEVTGFPGELKAENITGIVVHSDLEQSSSFECSNELVNRLNQNILWSQKSNYFDVPTDCPQRDERMGWTGDAQVFMPTAAYNMNIAPFFTKWMVDVMDGQFRDGRFPSTAPRVYKRVAAGWGDAGVICPWQMHAFYGDTRMMRAYYPHMVDYVNYLDSTSDKHISTMGSYGDWQNVDSETPIEVLATAYFKRSVDLISEMAAMLEKDEDQQRFMDLSYNIQKAFSDSLVNDTIKGNTQTVYLFALTFDLVDESEKPRMLKHLIQRIYDADTTLTTGIHGTALLLPVLSEFGHTDLAYKLLLNTKFPSWGHHIENGATTIWERWDGFSYEKGFHKDSTNSLNHYAYGSVGEWLYSNIAGIQNGGNAFKEIIIAPQIGGGLTYANTEYHSIRGKITSSWKLENDSLEMEVEIPPNTEATVIIPTDLPESILESGKALKDVNGILNLEMEGQRVTIKVGSGHYRFRAAFGRS